MKDPWAKPKGCRIEGGRWGGGVGETGGGEIETTIFEQQ